MSAIHEKLVAVTRQIAQNGIGKTRDNKQQGYKFRGVDEVMNAFAPILAEHGLFIRPRFTDRNVIERVTKTGSALFYVTVQGEFDFVDEAGGSVTVGPFFGEAMDSADKATNKAMAVAFKYAMFQTFCVPLEGVTGGDADAETHEVTSDMESRSSDYAEAIKSASSPEELAKVGKDLAASKLPPVMLKALRGLYSARQAELAGKKAA